MLNPYEAWTRRQAGRDWETHSCMHTGRKKIVSIGAAYVREKTSTLYSRMHCIARTDSQ